MQMNITGRHIDITDSLHAYTEEKMKRLEKHCDHIGNVHVILTLEKDRKKAEATIQIGKKDIYADSENTDLYKALDDLSKKLDRQLKRHKEKTQSHRNNGKFTEQ
ncbi:Ribosome hibernation protein YhbH [uncultured Candidatus Thioglobus sp.]|nr:Ribosome hibernation protein YhbH [uncultured Candidatus Thioglobus sp.]